MVRKFGGVHFRLSGLGGIGFRAVVDRNTKLMGLGFFGCLVQLDSVSDFLTAVLACGVPKQWGCFREP